MSNSLRHTAIRLFVIAFLLSLFPNAKAQNKMSSDTKPYKINVPEKEMSNLKKFLLLPAGRMK